MRRTLIAIVAFAAACNVGPVAWEEPIVMDSPAPASRLVIHDAGAAFVVPDPDTVSFRPAGACSGSVRFAQGLDSELHAVWWQPRRDGGAALLASRSLDSGVSWAAPVPVDTLDRARLDCRRPAPAITVDPLTRYVHVAYFLHGPHGPGVFFTHSMERGTFYHAPVPIVYGERPVAVSIASEGSAVAIAFQDPNTSAPRISVALSSTDGHLFEHRLPRISASGTAADRPNVSVRGDRLAVSWRARAIGGTGESVTIVRSGVVSWGCRGGYACEDR